MSTPKISEIAVPTSTETFLEQTKVLREDIFILKNISLNGEQIILEPTYLTSTKRNMLETYLKINTVVF